MSSSTTPNYVTQYGFYFDQGRCIDCKTCTVACKSWYNTAPGPSKKLRVMEWETGSWPNVSLHALFAPCYHCANAVCVVAAKGAMFKESRYGAVLIDPAQETSSALRDAADACPYGAIVFDSDSATAKADKCTMCIDRLDQGLQPLCVMSCFMRALDFGPLDLLRQKYPNASKELQGLPASSGTSPSILFKLPIDHQALVPYDASQAIQLNAKRDPYPAIYTDPSVLTPQPGVVGRSSLNLKPKNSAELMKATQNDEG
jgi:anaerobic dimethyl sulfoxide reductase subunit B (iron-sulfur subunit)